MPYIDQEIQREHIRDWYRGEYAGNRKFREAEKLRQREHYELNREKIIARVMARRAELRKASMA